MSVSIIAIDPGYDRCGVAIMSEVHGKPEVIFSSCLTTKKTDGQELRLASIFTELTTLIETHKPEYLALETLFFSVNKKTAIKVAEARGAILLLAGLHSLPLIEIAPQTVKIALTGVGNATKEQVQKMVALTVLKHKTAVLDDEIDAIALGVTGLQLVKKKMLEKGIAKGDRF